jgi:dolichol-phosphate mannosyltransferase
LVLKKLVIIPTYKEKENIQLIVDAISNLQNNYHILVIDDASPDGTATIVKDLQQSRADFLHLIERPGKLGLGTAYITGFKWGLERSYDYLFEMDADFSHDPKDLNRLLDACSNGADVAIGSRYVKGGAFKNWPFKRKIISLTGSLYSRLLTFMPVKDPTAGFVCYSSKVLREMNLDAIKFVGYAFQIEMKFAAWHLGYKLKEVPIVFQDRELGASKMSKGIIKEAALGVLILQLQYLSGSFMRHIRKSA